MKIWVVVVGRPRPPLAEAVAEYERRAARYWSVEAIEIREEKGGRAGDAAAVRWAESRRLLERVPAEADLVLLTREGERWSSSELAEYLQRLAVHGRAGAAFVIGGAAGLELPAVTRSHRRLSLSAMTLPHELARLVLAEQLYRAGTITRGEPYHRSGG